MRTTDAVWIGLRPGFETMSEDHRLGGDDRKRIAGILEKAEERGHTAVEEDNFLVWCLQNLFVKVPRATV